MEISYNDKSIEIEEKRLEQLKYVISHKNIQLNNLKHDYENKISKLQSEIDSLVKTYNYGINIVNRLKNSKHDK